MTSESWTNLRVLRWTTERFEREGLDSPRLDAELLLAHCLGVDRVRLYVDFERPLTPEELARYRQTIQRRLGREPVAYITGAREFWSLSLLVSRDVLIPRPESETLVERSLALLQQIGEPSPLVVDVGTGSGAIAVALATEVPDARVVAVDIAPAALELARANADRTGVSLSLFGGDLLDAVPDDAGAPDLIVANLPYVTSAELEALQPEVARWEPRLALDGGEDGLDLFRRLIPQAVRRLRTTGAIVLEIGQGQSERVIDLLGRHGLVEVEVHRDLAGIARVVSGRRS